VGGAELIDRDRRLPGHVKVEREALALLLTKPDDAGPRLADANEEEFTSPVRREVFRRALELLSSGRPADAAGAAGLSPDAQALFTELTMMDIPEDDLDARVREVFTRVRLFALERDIKTRRNTLQDVNPLEDPERHDALFTELVALEARRRDLLRLLQNEPEEVEA
ncbi:MAG TPA: hypothetical protein VG408_06325, partial [Actinomycetota bacterium]|nr:hypothetical protein [Actinomycetota bacterium]